MLKAVFLLATVLVSLATAQSLLPACQNLSFNGNSYDLSALAASSSISVNKQDSSGNTFIFEFAVCHAIPAACPLQDGSGFPSTCAGGNTAGVCQEWGGGSGTACCGAATSLAVASNGNGLTLTYSGGDSCNGCTSARNSVINIACAAGKTGPLSPSDVTVTLPDSTVINIVPTYTLSFSHAAGCPAGAPGSAPLAPGAPAPPAGISAGSVMLIIIFVGFFIYMVAGIVIQRVKFEQTGVRMVPNYEFWSDLPFLVKDGFRFLINKCTGNSGGYTTVKDQP